MIGYFGKNKYLRKKITNILMSFLSKLIRKIYVRKSSLVIPKKIIEDTTNTDKETSDNKNTETIKTKIKSYGVRIVTKFTCYKCHKFVDGKGLFVATMNFDIKANKEIENTKKYNILCKVCEKVYEKST